MASSTSATTSSRNSDLRRNSLSKPDSNNLRNHHHQISQNASAAAALPSQAQTTTRESTLLNAEITLLDAAGAIAPITDVAAPVRKKTVDDVWREIVAGKKTAAIEPPRRVEPKEEAMEEMMTLEDFLVKAGAVEESAVAAATAAEGEVKVEPTAAVAGTSGGMFAFESPYMARQGSVESGGILRYGSEGGLEAMGSGVVGDGLRRKRTASNLLEPMDKAAQQRQRRMIKNRESAARSRERKQVRILKDDSICLILLPFVVLSIGGIL